MRAAFMLDELKRQSVEGKLSKDDFDARTTYWTEIRKGNTSIEILESTQENPSKPEAVPVINFSDPIQKKISELEGLLQNLDLEKAHYCQESVNDDRDNAEISKKILNCREKWVAVKAQLEFIKSTGTMPDDKSDDQLPDDRYELSQLLEKLKINMDNYSKRSRNSKTELARQENQIKYEQTKAKRAAAREKLNRLNELLNG